jgi:hypothetical protein
MPEIINMPVYASILIVLSDFLIHDIRLAEEKWKSRFNKAAKDNYHEMGILSFSVVFYTLKNGQQAVDM